MCDKVNYETKRIAKKQLKKIKYKPGFSPTRANVYLCMCGFWHIGHHKKGFHLK